MLVYNAVPLSNKLNLCKAVAACQHSNKILDTFLNTRLNMSAKILPNKTSYDERTKIWSGIKSSPKYGPQSSIGQVALEELMKNPEHIAQICYHNGRQYTNREIARLSVRVAENFKKLSVQQCDIIGLCASNSDYLAPLFFGAMLSGLTVSTLDPSFDEDGIKHIFSITRPKVMFCDGAVYQTVKSALKEINLDIKIYTMKDHIAGVPSITEFLQPTGNEQHFSMEPLTLGHAQTAAILCSSGTTGLPKGVCMSHGSLLNSGIFRLDPEDKFLCFSTLYWLSGLICLICGTMEGATRVISDQGFSPEHLFDIVEHCKVTVLFTPPSQIAMSVASPRISHAKLTSVASFISGGSAVPNSLIEKIKPYMPNTCFVTGYGMSEVSAAISYGIASASGSTGALSRNCEMKVIDEHGRNLGPTEVGELCIRTKFVWAGYFGNPEATAAVYQKDGWVHSGDLGYVDGEGNVFIVDRKKEILKYNNFHFFPTEIESVILEMPGVAEVSVCGIPDLVASHLPAAAIVKNRECAALTEEAVRQYVAERMAHFKHLRGGVYFLKELPKTVSGKNLRRKVTEICVDLHSRAKQKEGGEQLLMQQTGITAV